LSDFNLDCSFQSCHKTVRLSLSWPTTRYQLLIRKGLSLIRWPNINSVAHEELTESLVFVFMLRTYFSLSEIRRQTWARKAQSKWQKTLKEKKTGKHAYEK